MSHVTCPYRLGGRLFGTVTSNFAVPSAWDGQLLVCQLTSVTRFSVEGWTSRVIRICTDITINNDL